MQNKKSIPVKPNILIVTFFILFFCVGLCIFKDHGVGWDEGNNRHYGYLVLNHVTGHNLIPKHSPSSFHDPEALGDTFDEHFAKVHGPVFEVLLVSLEIFLNAKDLREIYLLRHLAGFIIFFIGSFSSFYCAGIYLTTGK